MSSAEPAFEPRFAITLAPDPLMAPEGFLNPRSYTYQIMRRHLRHARGILMVGSGVVAAAAVHLAAFGRPTYCYSYNDPFTRLKSPPIGSAVAAGVGIGLLVGGGIKLARVPSEFRRIRPANGGRLAGLLLGALASGAVASLLLFGSTVPPDAQLLLKALEGGAPLRRALKRAPQLT